ncbi:MAG: glycosyltransferase family 4 protein [Spirochaetaceae bacterium]|nr:glycosyltransferase family 4 protein [Spirochaetaceae bacterium]
MKIVIDCRMINSSGVGVYLKEILRYLLDSTHEFLLLGYSSEIIQNVNFKSLNKRIKILDYPKKTFSVDELLFGLPHKTRKLINSYDLYYTPFFNIPKGIKKPIFSTIHDVVFPDMPELTSWLGLKIRMCFFKRAVKKSKLIFTVSEFSKERIQHYFGSKKPIVVTYNGIPEYLSQLKEHPEKEKIAFDKPFLLFIGNIKKHKGLSVLLQALSLCKEQGLNLKLFIVGNGENFRTKDSTLDAKQANVAFTGFLSEEVLREYIKNAALLVQPSLYEGFGIPPLEAMSLGTPVLVSDIPVFKEIYADFPVTFFEAGNATDLSKRLIKLFENGIPQRVNLSDSQKTKYTYEKTANIVKKTLETN